MVGLLFRFKGLTKVVGYGVMLWLCSAQWHKQNAPHPHSPYLVASFRAT